MSLVLNFRYKYISSFVEKIPSIFSCEGVSIYKSRNEIKIFQVDDLTINVKSYKKPIFINRIAYTFFMESKAKRAYVYALRLMSLGVNTAEPIAYIEEKSNGFGISCENGSGKEKKDDSDASKRVSKQIKYINKIRKRSEERSAGKRE